MFIDFNVWDHKSSLDICVCIIWRCLFWRFLFVLARDSIFFHIDCICEMPHQHQPCFIRHSLDRLNDFHLTQMMVFNSDPTITQGFQIQIEQLVMISSTSTKLTCRGMAMALMVIVKIDAGTRGMDMANPYQTIITKRRCLVPVITICLPQPFNCSFGNCFHSFVRPLNMSVSASHFLFGTLMSVHTPTFCKDTNPTMARSPCPIITHRKCGAFSFPSPRESGFLEPPQVPIQTRDGVSWMQMEEESNSCCLVHNNAFHQWVRCLSNVVDESICFHNLQPTQSVALCDSKTV